MLVAPEALASSIVVEHLATVREVQVRVVDGGLLFEPIQGLDRSALDEFREELLGMMKHAFTDAKIAVVDRADSTIVLDMRHAWGSPRTDQVALLVELTVEQRATSFEGMEPTLVSPIWVTVWKDGRISLTSTEKAREELLEQARHEIERLTAAIQQAFAYTTRKSR